MENISRHERSRAAMLGFAIGDALGATTEFMEPEEIREEYGLLTEIVGGGWLDLTPGETTDDTAMMLCVARSLAESSGKPDYRDMAERLLEWLKSDPRDIGTACRTGLCTYRDTGSLINGDDTSRGNGGLLRCLPFVVAGLDAGDALANVRLTHNSPWQDRAVTSYMAIVQAGLDGADRESVIACVQREGMQGEGICSNRGEVMITLSSALHWFSTTAGFEECVIAAANAGNDSDSVAAIAGSIAGACYGPAAIPQRWLGVLDQRVRREVTDLASVLTVTDVKQGGPYKSCDQKMT